jgi:hypothetical protein
MYEREAKYHLRSFSAAVLLVMIAYYVIAAFHLPNPVKVLRSGGWTLVVSWYMWVIVLLGVVAKIGILFSFGTTISGPRKLIPALLTVSFYLVLLGAISLSLALVASKLPSLLTSFYWRKSHWFWIGLLVFLAYGFFGLLIGRFGLFHWQALRNLKAIPVVCPVFCFGGPHFL